jgi:hypothetical protein
MRRSALALVLAGLWLAGPPRTGSAGEAPGDLDAAIRHLSEGLFLKKTVQAEQAAVRARVPSEYSLELRPEIRDDRAGVALRLYLPGRWDREALRQRLALTTQAETLRVAELEWQELIQVYRDLSTYRLLRTQIALHADEMAHLAPWLGQADQGVLERQLSVADRAEIYSRYLDLLNSRQRLETAKTRIELDLHRALGRRADLEAFVGLLPFGQPPDCG